MNITKASIPISDIFYRGIENAQLTESISEVLYNSKAIIFAPGNPITSIGSILNIQSLSKIIEPLKEKVIIISPFVSNKIISGPSEIYMSAKKIHPSIKGLIDFYSEFTTNMVFSKKDKKEIEKEITKDYSHINFYFTDIIMNNTAKEEAFAKYLISNFINS